MDLSKKWLLQDGDLNFPQCNKCKNYNRNKPVTCKAYPDGIPDEISGNIHDHKTPYPGDNGIQFEQIEEEND